MIEVSVDNRARAAMKRAHEERSQVLRDAWHWLFPSRTPR